MDSIMLLLAVLLVVLYPFVIIPLYPPIHPVKHEFNL